MVFYYNKLQKLKVASGDILATTLQEVYQDFVIEYGDTIDDYSYYILTPEEETRFRNNEEHELVFNGPVLESLDFTKEDTLPWLRATTNRTNIMMSNGEDTALVTLQIWEPNKSGIMTSINVSKKIWIQPPLGSAVKLDCTFVDGQYSFNFFSNIPGAWRFPSKKVYQDDYNTRVRIYNIATVNVFMKFL